MLTEKEAKDKWCPFTRVSDTDESQGPYNRFETESPWGLGVVCIGSACMAWRVAQPEIRMERNSESEKCMNREGLNRNQHVRVDPKASPSSGYDVLVLDARGFCGLAGKP